MKILSRAAGAVALLLFLGVMSTGYTLAQSATTPLVLKLADRADSSRYPDISVSLSAVDALGRPLDALTAADVVATDDIGAVEVRDVGSRVDAATRVAWVILVDTSGSMTDRRGDGSTYIDGARGFVNQVLGQLGDGDVARLVVFNEGTTSLTSWRPKTDGTLKNAANTIQASAKRTFLSSALTDASTMAANPPPGYDRRAIVLVTDMDSRDRDDSLSLDAIRSTLGAPIYAFSMRQPTTADAQLTLFLTDVRDHTGGGYSIVRTSDEVTKPLRDIADGLHRVWDVRLRTGRQPDGAEHAVDLSITRQGQRFGSVSAPYIAGTLFAVSPLTVTGIDYGDRVTGDRDVAFGLGGDVWSTARLELYRDCAPGSCQPVAASDTTSLRYRLQAGPLPQGDHRLAIRATVRDNSGREFSDELIFSFVRTGTTWNFAALFLIGGIAAAGMAATAIAVRRRRGGDPTA